MGMTPLSRARERLCGERMSAVRSVQVHAAVAAPPSVHPDGRVWAAVRT
ncbi:hypothetical protein SCATT_18440 [Streptantibioticus cattleyicolor NRRL 8057 = DSM 46488]|uniref:Uncharacterized protein n=1 Tax=Streptantibioticus cattleyicolor (strain ATCC 35852 / DSM 46488 / JCM 4925 / NBRC 14057 / NRRL 8057) TaxID=1003195 RepID=G8WRT1_STREN|nr:hypothetical protein SCATT_18440 [Streptantibioticus cattleyicolor NRRL 8057 = DSM 46488]